MAIFDYRKGEKRVAKNGQTMVIIEYRSSNSIDVKFEDGTIVKNKSYSNFVSGEIGNPNFPFYPRRKDRVGETKVAKNGMRMTIKVYRSAKDIDIEFEDGTEVKHRTYQCFDKGEIKNKNLEHGAMFRDRTGEKALATCGKEMTIVAYRGAMDIDIEFEDGARVYHKTYSHFINGEIKYPIKKRVESAAE